MATLQTGGFALSALPRAPAIPANVGAVDVREIYDGVRQGLTAFETARRALPGMALADAEMKAKTLQAPMGTALMEEQVAQGPLRTAVLAEQASPERLAIEREALKARAAPKAMTGLPFLFNRVDELTRILAVDPTNTEAAEDLAFTRSVIKEKEAIAAAKNATQIQTSEMKTEAQRDIAALNDDRLRELAKTGDETRRTLAANELASRANIASEKNKALVEAAAAKREETRMVREQKLAGVDKKNQALLSKQLGALEAIEQNTDNVETMIAEAIALTDYTTAGPAALSSFLPLGARTLKGKLSTIRANVGFDALANMRATSPTGGALGPVSDIENKLLQDTIAAIDQGLAPSELIVNLNKIKAVRADKLAQAQDMYERDVELLTGGKIPVTTITPEGAPATTTPPAATEQTIEERLKKYR